MFFEEDAPTLNELCRLLTESVEWTSDSRVSTRSAEPDWKIIDSQTDWVAETGLSIKQLFSQIVPLPEAGPNSMRAEILLTGFARDVISSGPEGKVVIKGSISLDAKIWKSLQSKNNARSIAFRL
jgi:hypothetical protein